MISGPLFVGHAYTLEREIVALSESRRTDSYAGYRNDSSR